MSARWRDDNSLGLRTFDVETASDAILQAPQMARPAVGSTTVFVIFRMETVLTTSTIAEPLVTTCTKCRFVDTLVVIFY